MLLQFEGRLPTSKQRVIGADQDPKKHSLYLGNIMGNGPQVLAIDQGTTSSRAIVFDLDGSMVSTAQQELDQIYPQPGWVEHDPELIWNTTLAVCRQVISQVGNNIAAIGIANQRETVLLWDKVSGRPIHNAIVWQDRRTADRCETLRAAGHEADVSARTGLLLDPYFSATKLAWLLSHVPGARTRAEHGELAAGTIDTFLLWRLTGGAVHATDATNASRTALFNIHSQMWDDTLLERFNIPAVILPEVRDSVSDFGQTISEHFGRSIPIFGIAGDQQAALIGQSCFSPGMLKSTYGTGAFAMLNTGTTPVTSTTRLLTTIGYRLNGIPTYALEGSLFIAGAALQWLRDELGVIESAAASETLAAALSSNEGVYFVPAFTGLGAPHWDPHARGAVFGITRGTGANALTRAAIESVCYQTVDLLTAMNSDYPQKVHAIRVDGGMAENAWFLQFLADITGAPIERPVVTETTALGAAGLAALGAGLVDSIDALAQRWQLRDVYMPSMQENDRSRLLANWRRAVLATQAFAQLPKASHHDVSLA